MRSVIGRAAESGNLSMDAVQRSAVFVRVGQRLLPESGALARGNPQTNMIDRDSESWCRDSFKAAGSALAKSAWRCTMTGAVAL